MFQRQTSLRKEQDTRVNPFPLASPARTTVKISRNQSLSDTQQSAYNNFYSNAATDSPRDGANNTSAVSSQLLSTLNPSAPRPWNKVLAAGSQIFSTRPRANTSTSKHSRYNTSVDERKNLSCGQSTTKYNNFPIPDAAITYTLSQASCSNIIVVVPRQAHVDTRPLYYVSVGHDAFLPTSLVTSIFRGTSDQGVYVGAFLTTLLESDNSGQAISIRGFERKQADLFRPGTKKRGSNNQTFEWGEEDTTQTRLQWACPDWPAAGTFTCRNTIDNQIYAYYNVSTSRRLEPKENPSLTVLPIGHPVFDDLIFSILLLERRRLSLLSASSDTSPHNQLDKKKL